MAVRERSSPFGNRPGDERHTRLVWRLLAVNAAVIALATAFLSLSPASVPSPGSLGSVLSLLGGMGVLIAANLVLLRAALRPLRRLTEMMERVDPLRPGERIPEEREGDEEVVELTRAFNAMLERLEDERRDATRRTLEAQEDERRRIARELHDEIGQDLTAALLQLEGVARAAPQELRPKIAEASETVRSGLEEARKVATRLRPEALDNLGLESAIAALATRMKANTGLQVELEVRGPLPPLPADREIAAYRVVQEALTNTLRHARAKHARVCLEPSRNGVRLWVADDGIGLDGAAPGGGLRGMLERAILVDGTLDFSSAEDGRGLRVTLEIPLERSP